MRLAKTCIKVENARAIVRVAVGLNIRSISKDKGILWRIAVVLKIEIDMTFIYCLLAFGAGFFLGIFAIALIVFSGDKEKRE